MLCALVLVPRAFSRNRFFRLHEGHEARRTRRRAARVRGVVRQMVGDGGRPKAEIVGEQILGDGQVLLRYRVEQLGLSRTVALSAIEASALRYALHRAGILPLDEADRVVVEDALRRLGDGLGLESIGV
jgi:hypothetical protein